jgi:MurNAc alpha-1-phosphate uridylyltransferase
MTLQAVILAGGLATRLHPITTSVPKSLIPVCGRPFLSWQLELLKESGFEEVLLLVGHLADQIRAFAGDGSAFGLTIRYAEDGPRLLGTGGALRRALAELKGEFLVTYGDSFLPFDYSAPLRDLLDHPEASGTMAVFENRGRWDKSNTCVRGEIVARYEKNAAPGDPSFPFIDYGATALRKSVVAAYPDETAFGLDVIQSALVEQGKLRAYRAPERFYEIGSPAGLEELEAYLAARSGRR